MSSRLTEFKKLPSGSYPTTDLVYEFDLRRLLHVIADPFFRITRDGATPASSRPGINLMKPGLPDFS
jgi:hypothetical protein